MREIVDAIVNTAFTSNQETLIEGFNFDTERQNQLLFFFKPEVFMVEAQHQSVAIVEMALSRFREFGVQVTGCLVLSGERLAELEAMDRHYGFINRMSKRASQDLSDEDRAALHHILGLEGTLPILGGHEFLGQNKEYDHQSLDQMWARKRSVKLRSGLYAQVYEVGGEEFIMVNGFHPAQLAHFTAPDRKITLLLLHSDAPWRVLRRRMLGDTFPEKALPGSIRGTLYYNALPYGLGHVNIANNCVHLSAGPFEALLELNNFLCRTETVAYTAEMSRVARLMKEAGLPDATVRSAMANPKAVLNESEVSLFDATEELDTCSSIELYCLSFRV